MLGGWLFRASRARHDSVDRRRQRPRCKYPLWGAWNSDLDQPYTLGWRRRLGDLVPRLTARFITRERRVVAAGQPLWTYTKFPTERSGSCAAGSHTPDPPILIKDALYEGPNSLVNQSLHSRLGAEPNNGDGFGVRWYGAPDTPGVCHSTEPAWNDENLRGALAGHISSPLFFTHIRAAIGSAVQPTNCHPFRHGHWLFMHNGYINEFAQIKRDLSRRRPLALPGHPRPGRHRGAVLPRAHLRPRGRPPTAVGQAIGLVEEVAESHGVPNPFQGTVATTDGESIWAFRYSSERKSRSLFYTTDVPTLRKLYPERQLFQDVSDNARLIVSEPLGDVAGVWNEVPESSWGVIGPDREEMQPFRPKAPAAPVPVVG